MSTLPPSLRTIAYTKRLNNSVNGSPRYRVTFTDGSTALTKSDSSCAYDIQNLSHSRYDGAELAITWTRAGRIETITVVSVPSETETQEEYEAALRFVKLG